jgi:hydrogenase/urease accessory protein HupE
MKYLSPYRLGVLLLALLPLIALAHGISDEDKQRMLDGGYVQYILLGASHMLTGYDHLLFLLGVVFF